MLTIHDIDVRTIIGGPMTLSAFAGRALLIVNVASRCGLTPQYAGLTALHDRYAARGLSILGFPSNNFRGQEPGTNAEIAAFCSTEYGVAFPMFEKIDVTGPDMHPLYRALIAAAPTALFNEGSTLLERLPQQPAEPGGIHWNFEKFLVDRQGAVIDRFAPDVLPTDERLTARIESTLRDH